MKKKIIGIVILVLIIVIVFLPIGPSRMSVAEYIRLYLYFFWDIEPLTLFPQIPAITPAGKIAYTVPLRIGNGKIEYGAIYIFDLEKEETKLFLRDLRIAGPIAWSSDGKKIIFVSPPPGLDFTKIYTLDLETGKITKIDKLENYHIYTISLNPDGQKLVFCATKVKGTIMTEGYAIYIYLLQERKITKLYP